MRLNSGAHTWIKPRWVAPAASLAAPTVALPLALRQPLRHSTNELLQKAARLAFLGHREAVQDLRHALLELNPKNSPLGLIWPCRQPLAPRFQC